MATLFAHIKFFFGPTKSAFMVKHTTKKLTSDQWWTFIIILHACIKDSSNNIVLTSFKSFGRMNDEGQIYNAQGPSYDLQRFTQSECESDRYNVT